MNVKRIMKRVYAWDCGVKEHVHTEEEDALRCPQGHTVRSINILRDYLIAPITLREAAQKNGLKNPDRSLYIACTALNAPQTFRDDDGAFNHAEFDAFLESTSGAGVRKNRASWLEKIRLFQGG
jgi:hypothetical protein